MFGPKENFWLSISKIECKNDIHGFLSKAMVDHSFPK